ncbi:MAG TPA: GNAT family N-acetyltransferase [Solirubrobacter sp.]|nr:GNAT family N-acetyltransferase [Solirubrobacter sp.]
MPRMLSDGDITLRAPHAGDIDALVVACQDPEIPRWTPIPSPYRRADAVAYLDRVASAANERHFLAVDAHGTLLGSFSVMGIDGRYGEIGYWVAAEARGKGVATRAVVLLRDWAVAELGLEELELIIHVDNAVSRRVAERTGFLETGERRPAPRQSESPARDYAVYVFRAS